MTYLMIPWLATLKLSTLSSRESAEISVAGVPRGWYNPGEAESWRSRQWPVDAAINEGCGLCFAVISQSSKLRLISGAVLTYLMIPWLATLKLSTSSGENAEIFVAGVPQCEIQIFQKIFVSPVLRSHQSVVQSTSSFIREIRCKVLRILGVWATRFTSVLLTDDLRTGIIRFSI